tara:strand:+ start:223 stop:504 length:282 start_codon:yes stop_codon:yes gene_type:complete
MILTTIDGIPLYSTAVEAIAHANRIGIQGYHEHIFRGRVGYMAGANHNEISRVLPSLPSAIQPQSTAPDIQTTTSSSTSSTPTNTGSGGSGGY